MRTFVFYITRAAVFLPAPLYGLVVLARDGHFELWKYYLPGLGILLLLVFLTARRSLATSGIRGARGRGLILFALLQFHWTLLVLPIVTPAALWVGMALAAVLLAGVFARAARPWTHPIVLLLVAGVGVALGTGGAFPFMPGEGPVGPAALVHFEPGTVRCFWSLFFNQNACTLAEAYPEVLPLTLIFLLIFDRRYLWEALLAALLFGVAAFFSGLEQAALIGAMSLTAILTPGRERFTKRGWLGYGTVWICVFAGLFGSQWFAPEFFFYFQKNGSGNSWLFWVAGFSLAESLFMILRLRESWRDLPG